MRYRIFFADKTSKTVSEDEGKGLATAWAAGRTPLFVAGSAYAAHVISSIKTMKDYVDEQDELARRERKRFCKHGQSHPTDERCGCREAGIPLLEAEEAGHLFPALRRPEQPKMLARGKDTPQTEEEKCRQKYYEEQRTIFLSSRTMQTDRSIINADSGCKGCGGKGTYLLEGVSVTCNCILDQKFAPGPRHLTT